MFAYLLRASNARYTIGAVVSWPICLQQPLCRDLAFPKAEMTADTTESSRIVVSARILQILSDQFQLLRRIAPPTHDLRRL
jgi:hypothetical protein